MRVVFVTAILTHYRVPFHERVRERLAEHGVTYDLVFGQPLGSETLKNDTVSLPWATFVPNRLLRIGRRSLGLWQPILRHICGADLVVLGQENRLLVNYGLQLLPQAMRPSLALWGHGRNFQSIKPYGAAERWKRLWATRCDWWFGYTDESRRRIEALGFAPERITVFNNAVDTNTLRRLCVEIDEEDAAAARARLRLSGDNVAVFVGGLYANKRLDFLIEAADLIREFVPDFELVVVGDGADRGRLDALAAQRTWLHVLGPRFGRDKAVLLRAAKLFLMPGLLGLAVLDAAAAGLPVVTTAYPYHSPEISYLEDGVTGTVVGDWQNAQAYADAVISLLRDEPRRRSMAAAARSVAEGLTIEAMAERFAAGALQALAVLRPGRDLRR